MSVLSILESRYSVRGFKKDPVDAELIKSIFSQAQRSASNCNVQPWQSYVVSGETRDKVSEALVKAVMSGNPPNPKFDWVTRYQDEHRQRQFGSANALYSALGIAREDKMARNIAMLRNWQFFDAPHAVFFVMEKYMGIMGAVDIGIYAQTLSLLLEENGIQSCMQGALGQFPAPVEELLGIPESQGILFGMSFGYEDKEHPANAARTDRADLSDAVKFFT
ncbi:nitroreductase [Litorimonas taeanensis]|uniref:Nitroreductase n=1 Tax=Litorimonas taeanensis TaxID=568099 RepID=A0A420WDM9_9PROT|nr:nitroreductase [Litorimonas taeanensis]RKQ69020.1 nitroreductase [Litorimonas taeanensis]